MYALHWRRVTIGSLICITCVLHRAAHYTGTCFGSATYNMCRWIIYINGRASTWKRRGGWLNVRGQTRSYRS